MPKKKRHPYILHQVNLHNKVLPSYLSAGIHVSEDTIPCDLQGMIKEGKVINAQGVSQLHPFRQLHFPKDTVYSKNQVQKHRGSYTGNFGIKISNNLKNTLKSKSISIHWIQIRIKATTDYFVLNQVADHLPLKSVSTQALTRYN